MFWKKTITSISKEIMEQININEDLIKQVAVLENRVNWLVNQNKVMSDKLTNTLKKVDKEYKNNSMIIQAINEDRQAIGKIAEIIKVKIQPETTKTTKKGK